MIMSIDEIVALLRAQAEVRAPENDAAGVLLSVAATLKQEVDALERPINVIRIGRASDLNVHAWQFTAPEIPEDDFVIVYAATTRGAIQFFEEAYPGCKRFEVRWMSDNE